MSDDSPSCSLQEQEEMLQRYVRFYSPVRLFPVLESKENLWYFIARTAGPIAQRVNDQRLRESKSGRPDAAFLRGLTWLDKLIWNELWLYPTDFLVQRTARVYGIILQTPGLPRKPKNAHDPRRVLLEYELLREKFQSVFMRRPAMTNVRRLPEYHEATFGRARGGAFLSLIVDMINDQKLQTWINTRIRLAEKQLDIPWWLKNRSFELNEGDLLEFTSRDAALKVLVHFMKVKKDMVEQLIKNGSKLLTPEAYEALETAWKEGRHDPDACHYLQCCSHRVLNYVGQDPLPS
jgi:hypothetical protein